MRRSPASPWVRNYPFVDDRKRALRSPRTVVRMMLLGCWVPVALQSPGQSMSAQLMLGLAVAAVALLVVLAAAGVPVATRPSAPAGVARAVRVRVRRLSRLLDPDAAGRPRPRAPSVCPAASLRAY